MASFSLTGARFTKKMPSAKRSLNSAATCKPKRVLRLVTRTCQGEQAHILAVQQLLNGCQFLLAPNERCELDRQVIGMGIERSKRREVGRQVCNDELIEVVLLL